MSASSLAPRRRGIRRKIVILFAVAAILYAAVITGAYITMRQPPERFGAIMSRVPMPLMMLFPFRPLWMSARAGQLSVGDAAPDFELPVLDHSRTVRLSEEYRNRPVVLVFGSYT
jgi:hypothetical protein